MPASIPRRLRERTDTDAADRTTGTRSHPQAVAGNRATLPALEEVQAGVRRAGLNRRAATFRAGNQAGGELHPISGPLRRSERQHATVATRWTVSAGRRAPGIFVRIELAVGDRRPQLFSLKSAALIDECAGKLGGETVVNQPLHVAAAA